MCDPPKTALISIHPDKRAPTSLDSANTELQFTFTFW